MPGAVRTAGIWLGQWFCYGIRIYWNGSHHGGTHRRDTGVCSCQRSARSLYWTGRYAALTAALGERGLRLWLVRGC